MSRMAVGVALGIAVIVGFAGGIVTSVAGASQDPPTVAVLVRADNPVDAFSASAVAAQFGGGVFLTDQAQLSEVAAEGIRALDPDLVLIAGGPTAISHDVESDVDSLGYQWERLAGDTRIETARMLSALLQRYDVSRPVLIRDDGSSSVDLSGLSVRGLPVETSFDFLPSTSNYFLDPATCDGFVIIRGCEALDSPEASYHARSIDGSNVPDDAEATLRIGVTELDPGTEFCAKLYDVGRQESVAGSQVCLEGGPNGVDLRRVVGPTFRLPAGDSDYVVAVRTKGGETLFDSVALKVSN